VAVTNPEQGQLYSRHLHLGAFPSYYKIAEQNAPSPPPAVHSRPDGRYQRLVPVLFLTSLRSHLTVIVFASTKVQAKEK
jgi:hypothetical protein